MKLAIGSLLKREVVFSGPIPKAANIGCGHDKLQGYLNIDMDPACNPDVLIRDNDLSVLPQDHFERVLARDVLEHIPRTHTMGALLDWAALLKMGGVMELQTSSIVGIAQQMQTNDNFEFQFNWTPLMFGNQAHAGDYHFNGFTEKTLRVHLAVAGFDVDSFDLKDGWLFCTTVPKVRDWRAPLDVYAGETDVGFVAAIVRDVLHREADGDTLLHWPKAIARGAKTRLSVLRTFTACAENLFTTAKRLGI